LSFVLGHLMKSPPVNGRGPRIIANGTRSLDSRIDTQFDPRE
jgi:hypothetical protein